MEKEKLLNSKELDEVLKQITKSTNNTKKFQKFDYIKIVSYSSKLRSWHPVPTFHGNQMGKKWKQCQILFSWPLKSLWIVAAVMKFKNLAPWKKSYDKPRQYIKKEKHLN